MCKGTTQIVPHFVKEICTSMNFGIHGKKGGPGTNPLLIARNDSQEARNDSQWVGTHGYREFSCEGDMFFRMVRLKSLRLPDNMAKTPEHYCGTYYKKRKIRVLHNSRTSESLCSSPPLLNYKKGKQSQVRVASEMNVRSTLGWVVQLFKEAPAKVYCWHLTRNLWTPVL